MNKFIILSTQRSGSTYLRLWLNSHPAIRCHSEVFLRNYTDPDGFCYFIKKSLLREALFSISGKKNRKGYVNNLSIHYLISTFLNKLFFDKNHSGPWNEIDSRGDFIPQKDRDNVKSVGFKLMYNQLNDFVYLKRWLKKNNILILHLIRKNLLNIYISRIVSEKIKLYHSKVPISETKVKLDITHLLNSLKKISSEQILHKELFNNCILHEISYEDYFSPKSCFTTKQDILKFLNVDMVYIKEPNLRKINTLPQREILLNYDDVYATLKGTKYEQYLQK